MHLRTPARRVTIALVTLAALAIGVAAGSPAAAGGGTTPLAALLREAESEGSVQVIVELERLDAQGAVLEQARAAGAEVRTRYTLFPLLALEVGPSALVALAASPDVAAIHENALSEPMLDQTIPVINADDVHTLGFDGAGQTVAILDTGIDRDHPFFGSRIVSQACYSNAGGAGSGVSLCPDGTNAQTTGDAADSETANCLDGTNNICDHGPHVAGIAAGNGAGVSGAPATGVARGANIIAIQVFTRFNNMSDCGSNPAPCVRTFASDQILGLQRVLALSTAGGGTLSVAAANMSIGNNANNTSPCDTDSRKAAVDSLLAGGIATVISAGNEGHPAGVGTPGCISTAVTVGSTTDADAISDFSNRGDELDLFAPGSGVISSVPDDAFGSKNGTSMAAPHVAGAFAVLRDAYPTASVANMLTWMQDSGVDITYSSGGSNVTTPRLNLLAALQENNQGPSVTADSGTVSVNEGQTATNAGGFSDPESNPVTLSASRGTVSSPSPGRWSWSFGTNDGPTQSGPVTITATDDKGESGSVTFTLNVANVPPSVLLDPSQDKTIDEGETLSVAATFSDPGWADTYSSLISWGTPSGDTSAGSVSVTTSGPPADGGSVSGSHAYGDDGSFAVSIGVSDDDGGTGSAGFTASVANVAPTATIDEAGTTLVNGVPTFIAHEGVPVPFKGRSTDPGSDDLTLTWSWGDGPPAPDVSTTYLNGSSADLDPSPDVNPRDVTDSQPHAFGLACFYTVTFDARDDDSGNAIDDTVKVIIGGNASQQRGAGYWQTQYQPRPTAFTEARRLCYLAIAGHMSSVFDEMRSAATVAEAFNVLKLPGNSARDRLDRELLAAWLNFANGAFDLTELIDTNGDGTGDTTFAAVMANAEAVRLNPASTSGALLAQRDILERMNAG